MIADAFMDAVIDTVKIIPFLFITYLLMEYLESMTEDRIRTGLAKVKRTGPLWGAVVGVIPQCGFSAAAASLFAGGILSTGTLLAVFLSTSDEMLPVFISEHVPLTVIFRILCCKALLGMISGFVADLLPMRRKESAAGGHKEKHIHDLCEHEHCHCEGGSGGILRPALNHTVKVSAYLFVITFVLTCLIELVGEGAIAGLLTGMPVAGSLIAGLIGLIPNCAASVIIAKLYLTGMITSGQMLSGLLVGAGVGLLVLFRTNRDRRENVRICLMLYGVGVFWGIAADLLHIVF
ncbi:MAG: arsenic efflux protein [Eubacterium sp.]|nr:arsenic efflux protein [Eubacterium sp.]